MSDRETKCRNAYITTFLGKLTDHWVGIDHVMAAHQIETAKQLNDALNAKRKPEERVNIYDERNRDRLLGSIPKPSTQGPRFRVMVAQYLPMVPYEIKDIIAMDVRCETVEFSKEFRKISDWDIEPCLTTTAPLAVLMKCSDFRLPGESASMAAERAYWSR